MPSTAFYYLPVKSLLAVSISSLGAVWINTGIVSMSVFSLLSIHRLQILTVAVSMYEANILF